VVQLLWIFLRERPDVLVTTGSGPGMVALRLAKLIGARTMWIDSIANAGEVSLSGRRAGKHADVWLTQWEHLARPDGPHYEGSVF
jgi:UDP-N-acetylglucosamine:LPS N-acetylglucosamine transferase